MKKTILIIWRKRIVLPALVLLAGLGLALSNTNEFEIAKSLEIFSEVYKELNTHYVDEIDPEKLMTKTMQAMLSSLDPYSEYIPAEEVSALHGNLREHYAGLGGTIVAREGYPMVRALVQNAPADQAGLLPGDKIMAVDGKSLKGLSLKETVNFLRGPVGSRVELDIERAGESKRLRVGLKRQNIKNESLIYSSIDKEGIAYFTISSFSEQIAKSLEEELLALKKKQTIRAIILDLRGNTGGLLNEAVEMANIFLPRGEILLQTKGRELEDQKNYVARNSPVDTETPLVVLIDRNSASASEIVAGAIQDFDRGIILGQRSFGKGLVQQTRNLSFGAKLKLTTARYYTPSGRPVHARKYKNGKALIPADSLLQSYKTKGGRIVRDGGGIEPDVAIERSSLDEHLDQLQEGFYLFDFVQSYYKNKPKSINDINLGDADFDALLDFLQKRGYSYLSPGEELFRKFEKKLEEEHYEEALQKELKEIEATLPKDKSKQLQLYKKGILQALEEELAQFYFYEPGPYHIRANKSEEMRKAKEILLEPIRYRSILGR